MHDVFVVYYMYTFSVLQTGLRIRFWIRIPLVILMADPDQIFHFNAIPDLDPALQSDANQ